MDNSFTGPKLKIKRANKHIHELNTVHTAFINTDFYSLSVDEDTKTGEHDLTFQMTTNAPCEIPLIIGDAIHNLRSALDLAACEIVSRAGGIVDTRTDFPIKATRKETEGAINGGQIKIAGADIIALIVDVIKPYNDGGNQSLCALHSLDITDKHRLLIPIVSVTALNHVNIKVGETTYTDCTFRVSGSSGKLNILGMPINAEIQGTYQPSFDILFNEGILSGQSIIPTLKQLSEIVAGVIQNLEKTYLART